jgi:hypothetical protein
VRRQRGKKPGLDFLIADAHDGQQRVRSRTCICSPSTRGGELQLRTVRCVVMSLATGSRNGIERIIDEIPEGELEPRL